MKNSLFLAAALLFSFEMSAQNIIKNSDFSKEVTTQVTNPNKAQSGEWFILNTETPGGVEITCEEGAMKFSTTKETSWYKALIGQRIQSKDIAKGIYTLSFDVKGTPKNSPVAVYIRQTNDTKDADNKPVQTFILRDGFDMDANPSHSGAKASKNAVKSADQWTNVSFDFDFGKSINSVNSKNALGGKLQISEIEDGAPILSDFYIAIQPLKANQVLQIDNVSLVKK